MRTKQGRFIKLLFPYDGQDESEHFRNGCQCNRHVTYSFKNFRNGCQCNRHVTYSFKKFRDRTTKLILSVQIRVRNNLANEPSN